MNSTTTRKLNSSSIGIPNLTIISLNNFLVVFNQYLTIYFYPVGIVLTIGTNVIAIGTLASRSIDIGLSQRMHQYGNICSRPQYGVCKSFMGFSW